MSIKLLIADDHEMIRLGLKHLLIGSDIEIVAQASTGEATMRALTKRQPDMVLLDVRMAEGDGLDTLRRVRLNWPEVPVLMFSAFDNRAYIARAVKLGAKGYLLKGASRKELIRAINAVAAGKSIWSRKELRRFTPEPASSRYYEVEAPLTKRECEILQRLARGMTNDEIVLDLRINYHTVKEYTTNLLLKLGVADRMQAAVWGAQKELLDTARLAQNRSQPR